LNRLISPVLFLGTVVRSFAVAVDDAQRGVAEFDGDGAPGVRQADVDALAGDLDAAAAGYPALDDRAGGRERLRLRGDLERSAFLLGRSDGGPLFGMPQE
jgi:hypothetical protein